MVFENGTHSRLGHWIAANWRLNCSPAHALVILLVAAVSVDAGVATLVNRGFEQAAPDGSPLGWKVLTGLDPHGYGPPEYRIRLDQTLPTRCAGGRLSEHCLGFPPDVGTWECPVFSHSNGNGAGIDGKRLGKAAVYQMIDLPAGRYRFCVWLRTADGNRYSAAFSLGVNLGAPARYAHDGATGIRWARHDLAVRRSELRGARERGDWALYATEPFQLDQPGPVTVWIRFNYANENQMRARWQADDAAIVPCEDAQATQPAGHTPCEPPLAPLRWRVFCGDLEPYLVGLGGSSVVEAPEARLFRHARALAPDGVIRCRFPACEQGGPLVLLVAAAGPALVEAAGLSLQAGGGDPKRPTTYEWALPKGTDTSGGVNVTVRPRSAEPVRLFEVELGRPGRTVTRLLHVEADAVAVPWVVGSWDGSSREFAGKVQEITLDKPSALRTRQLAPVGRWTIRFAHRPAAGHRYYFVYGLLGGSCTIDVGADGIIDWVAETKGEEIVDVDVTELLVAGANTIVVGSSGQHDFAGLVEVCPGSTDLSKLQLAFEGDALATVFTRVIENTWFWLRELHYEPTGFVDASVPNGRWHNQYWPIDIAFALREWVRWGYHDESNRIARFVARRRWHGHSSNRSGGSDNTAGNILARELCEVLRRSDLAPEPVLSIWEAVRAHAAEVIDNADRSPFGLIRGTNWENAGNREHGPCYALTTSLGAAASLRKAASLAGRLDDAKSAAAWRDAARRLREAVLRHLVLRKDHRCPSGFVLPAGTWAYGLRVDGSIEDQPLAGYFWAAGAGADVEGLCPADSEVLGLYDRTLEAALPLLKTGQRGTVSGYAVSYDGPQALLVAAALCDRVNALDTLLHELLQETDAARDQGTQYGELSRWAYGGPDGSEDTNLVGAAGFLWALRTLAGIDDLLADNRQLRLIPRLPWQWNRLVVNDWPARCRDATGRQHWTRLTFELERDKTDARLRVRSSKVVRAMHARLGPFPMGSSLFTGALDGKKVPLRSEVSGDAAWAWAVLDAGPDETTVYVTIANTTPLTSMIPTAKPK